MGTLDRGYAYMHPQSMFKSKHKKMLHCKAQFYYINVGVRGSSLHGHVSMKLVFEVSGLIMLR